MGTATAAKTLGSFRKVQSAALFKFQMDELNFNWKMVEIAYEHRRKQDPGAPSLPTTGSCDLHVLHGAYKTAQSFTSWKLDKFLETGFLFSRKALLEEQAIFNVMISLRRMKARVLLIICTEVLWASLA